MAFSTIREKIENNAQASGEDRIVLLLLRVIIICYFK